MNKRLCSVINIIFCWTTVVFLSGCAYRESENRRDEEDKKIKIGEFDFDVMKENGRLFLQDAHSNRLRIALYTGTWEVDARIMFFRKPRHDPYSAYFDDEMERRIGSLLLNLFRLPRYNARIEPADAPGFPTISVALHVRDGQDVFDSKARVDFSYRGPNLDLPGYPSKTYDSLYWNQQDFGVLNIDMFGYMQATRQGVVRAGVRMSFLGRDDFTRMPYFPVSLDSPWFRRDVNAFTGMAEHWVKLCIADLVFVFDQVPEEYPRDRLATIKLALLADPRVRSGMTDQEFINALRRPVDAETPGTRSVSK